MFVILLRSNSDDGTDVIYGLYHTKNEAEAHVEDVTSALRATDDFDDLDLDETLECLEIVEVKSRGDFEADLADACLPPESSKHAAQPVDIEALNDEDRKKVIITIQRLKQQ